MVRFYVTRFHTEQFEFFCIFLLEPVLKISNFPVEIDYVQCPDLDMNAIIDPTVVNPEAAQETIPEPHKPMFNPDEVKQMHEG